jgi:hypothetical protein
MVIPTHIQNMEENWPIFNCFSQSSKEVCPLPSQLSLYLFIDYICYSESHLTPLPRKSIHISVSTHSFIFSIRFKKDLNMNFSIIDEIMNCDHCSLIICVFGQHFQFEEGEAF